MEKSLDAADENLDENDYLNQKLIQSDHNNDSGSAKDQWCQIIYNQPSLF